MVVSISFTRSPIFIFLAALVLVVVAIVILTRLEKKLKKKIEIEKQEESFYKVRIEHVKSLTNQPFNFVLALSNLAREFFSKEFGLEPSLRYSELIETFNKKGREDIVKFCEELQEALYGGQQFNKEVLSYLLDELVFLIRKQKKWKTEEKESEVKKNIVSDIIDSSTKVESKIDKKLEKDVSLITKKFLSPIKKEEKIDEKDALIKERTLFQKKEESKTKNKKQSANSLAYQEFIKSIDNLDRVKQKLVKAGKPMRF